MPFQKKRYCPRGHDTTVVGRKFRQCVQCIKERKYPWNAAARAKQRRYHAKHHEKRAETYRRGSFRRRYGITLEEYNTALIKQGGVCAVCEQAETTIRKGVVMMLSVDHDHKTGVFRGLLCNRCNRALGLANEDPAVLFKLSRYLLKSEPQVVEEMRLH